MRVIWSPLPVSLAMKNTFIVGIVQISKGLLLSVKHSSTWPGRVTYLRLALAGSKYPGGTWTTTLPLSPLTVQPTE